MTIEQIKPGLLLVYPPVGLVQVAQIGVVSAQDQTPFYQLQAMHVVGKPIVYITPDKAQQNGLRALSTRATYKEARAILRQCKRVYGGTSSINNKYSLEAWQRQIQTGEIKNYARIVRDFFRPAGEPPLKHQERGVFNEALTRLSAEAAGIFGWTTAPQIAKVKQHLLWLLTLPREDLPPEEEERTLDPISRHIARPINFNHGCRPLRITAPQVGRDPDQRGKFKLSSRTANRLTK